MSALPTMKRHITRDGTFIVREIHHYWFTFAQAIQAEANWNLDTMHSFSDRTGKPNCVRQTFTEPTHTTHYIMEYNGPETYTPASL